MPPPPPPTPTPTPVPPQPSLPPTAGPRVPPIELNPGNTPTTTPILPPAPAGAAAPGGADPAWYDLAGQASKAITDWINGLVRDGLSAVLDLLAQTALVTPDLTGEPRLVQIWGVTQGIANAAYVLLVLAGGVLVMGHETVQTRYTLKQIAPRVVLGFIALNTSLSVVGEGIRLANAATAALLGTDATPQAVGERLKTHVLGTLDQQAGIFLLLVALVIVVLTVVLLIVFVIRVALTVLLIVVAPLALACHALPVTDGAARMWWRALSGVLMIQLAQALALIVALQVFFTPTGVAGFGGGGVLMDLLVTLVMVWVLVRIPAWVGRHIGAQPSALTSVLTYATLSRALKHVPTSRGSSRSARAGRSQANRRGGPTVRPTPTGGSTPKSRPTTSRAATDSQSLPARSGRNAPSDLPPEYPLGNPNAKPAPWWGTPTFREPASRPPVQPPQFQPPRPPQPSTKPASARPPSRPHAPTAAVRRVPTVPRFSDAAATRTPAATPRTRTGVPAAQRFSAAAPPPAPVAGRGKPVPTFQAPGARPTTSTSAPQPAPAPAPPGSRRRGTGRSWVPPAGGARSASANQPRKGSGR